MVSTQSANCYWKCNTVNAERKPGIVIVNKMENTVIIIDVAVPGNKKITHHKKKSIRISKERSRHFGTLTKLMWYLYLKMVYKHSLWLMKTNQWKLQNAGLMKKRSDAQRNTSWVNIHDTRHYQHSCRSYSNQPIKYYKESSDWWLHDPKEHKEEQELRENWLKVCYLLHIIHPQSIFLIF